MVSNLIPLLVGAAVSLAILSFFVGFQRLARPEGEMAERLSDLEIVRPPVREKRRGESLKEFSNKLNLEERLGQQLRLHLMQADVALTVNEYTLIRIGAGFGGALVGALLLGNIVFGLLLGVLGFQLPVLWLNQRRRQRQHKFQSQLVDVLTMMVSGLRAGIGLVQAMDMVRREMPEPSSTEYGLVVREIGLGVSLDEALTHLLERMPSDDLAMVVTVIKIQAEVGGNLATVLEGVVETIRERVRIFQEIRTLTAQQRITGYILAGLPFFLGAAIMVINPGFLTPLFTPQWIWLPGLALLMIMMGFILINKIVDIKV